MKIKSAAAIVCVGPSKKIVGTSSEFLIIMKLIEEFLGNCPAGNVQQIQQGVFLCEMDSCFPAIATLIQEAKTYSAYVLVAELGGSPVMISPEYQEAAALLQGLGHRVQLTGPPLEKVIRHHKH